MMNNSDNDNNKNKREITFNSYPQNATIYINDKPILNEDGNPGRTPIVIVIPKGKYEVIYRLDLENEDYEDYHTSIEVSANSPDTIIGKLKLKSTNNDKIKNEKDNEKVSLKESNQKLESNQSNIENQSNNTTDNVTDIPSILKQLLISQQKMCELMEENLKRESESKTNIEKFLSYQSKIDEQVKSRESISRGDLKDKKFLNYLDRHFITAIGNGGGVIASDPNDFDSPLYLIVPVYQELERNADYMEVFNDGNDTLFCIISHGGGITNFSKEEPIYPGEGKIFKNVWELRFRSATTGLSFRVTEYEIEAGSDVTAGITDATNVAVNINTLGDNTIIAAPGAGIKIKILKLLFVCSGAVSVTLKSNATNLSGAMAFSANGGMGFDGDFTPLEMNANEAFVISLGGAVQVSGFVLYITEA